MIAATLCSGVGTPELAMPHWQWSLQSEIEAAPRSVLKYRFGAQDARQTRSAGPALWGDFTTIRVRHLLRLGVALPQWLIAGTPCQSFSVAGLRKGLSDDRGNLTMEFIRLVHSLRRAGSLRGIVWENVPGVLSSRDNAFGCFLAGIVGSDAPLHSPFERGRWPDAGMVSGPWGRAAWIIRDAQYFGVPQRRRRVYLVADFGNWTDPTRILFEPKGQGWHPSPRRKSRKVAPTIPSRSTGGGGLGTDFDCDGGLIEAFGGGNQAGTIDVATAQTAHSGRIDFDSETFITHSLRGEGFDASEDGTGRGTPLVPVAFSPQAGGDQTTLGYDPGSDISPSLGRTQTPAIAFSAKDHGGDAGEISPTLRSGNHRGSHANGGVMPAVAFDMRGREGGAQFEGPHDTANIRAADGGSSRSYIAGNFETRYGINHAETFEAHAVQSLRSLLSAVGEKALSQWSSGIVAAFWPKEVLQSGVYGDGFRWPTSCGRGVVNVALSCAKNRSAWTVRDLWEAGCEGCPPSGWEPSEQLARELGAYLSELPQSASPTERFLHDMRQASEGSGILLKALSAIQAARRSTCSDGQSVLHVRSVRRLIVEECEALQGYPRSHTLVPHRGKPMADGPRYKMCGNGMAKPCIEWILRRIEAMSEE